MRLNRSTLEPAAPPSDLRWHATKDVPGEALEDFRVSVQTLSTAAVLGENNSANNSSARAYIAN
jgi:hypothetical protein